jgi:hypothetical protein
MTKPSTTTQTRELEPWALLPAPEVQARQIVGAWRAVGDGNNDALLTGYIRQAIEENRATPSTTEQVIRLRKALVLAVIPYEAILMDAASRRWIAPEVWSAIENAVLAARTALSPKVETEGEREK